MKRSVVSRLHNTGMNFRTGMKISLWYETAGVILRWYDSFRYDILWWRHVNNYRVVRGNRGELAPIRKSPRYHVNTPLVYSAAVLLIVCLSQLSHASFAGFTASRMLCFGVW